MMDVPAYLKPSDVLPDIATRPDFLEVLDAKVEINGPPPRPCTCKIDGPDGLVAVGCRYLTLCDIDGYLHV